MKNHLRVISDIYAHDYRDIALDEAHLGAMLREFYEAVKDSELKEMSEAMYKDAVAKGETL